MPSPVAAPNPAAAPDPVAAPSLVVSSIPEAPSTTVPPAYVFVQTSKNGRKFYSVWCCIFFFLVFFDINEQTPSKAIKWEKLQLYDWRW